MMTFSQDPAVAKKQLLAIIFCLTAFGYSDGEFAASERKFVRDHIATLVNAHTRAAMPNADPLARTVAAERWTTQFHRVADAIDREIAALFTEYVAEGESTEQFVRARLALRCFELLKSFDNDARTSLFEVVHDLLMSDGGVQPAEEKFQQELQALLDAPPAADVPADAGQAQNFRIEPKEKLAPNPEEHPFLARFERAYASDSAAFATQAASDLALVRKVHATLEAQRAAGAGKLAGAKTFRDFAGQDSFLDGHVYVVPPIPGQDYEVIVIGDLHGCYSCLKAVLQQTNFLAKAQAFVDDPEHAPDTRLVLLGDYIDRGRFGFDGVLRTLLRLFVAAPHAVCLLRGNHEYYVEIQGKVLAPVRPAEAMMALKGIATNEFFSEFMGLFETLPNMLAFDETLFVHGGIPRDDTLAEKWKDLSSLNDPDLRFQMLWSDPSEADTVPSELQKSTARFSFGLHQLRSFLAKIGCTSLVRGHERIVEGFRTVYSASDATLVSLFSSGGANNLDLPETSNYREVTPMALTIRHRDGVSRVTPFVIDYEAYNDPTRNGFLKAP